ncbi:unnamed protein product [Gordionus sp. m RMFG-2023]
MVLSKAITLLLMLDITIVDINSLDTQFKKDLNIGGLVSLSGSWNGSYVIPAIELALQHVNLNKEVLTGYSLKWIWNDTKCDPGTGLKVFFDFLLQKPAKIFMLGDGCSVVSIPIASTAKNWNLVQVSYGSTSPGLSDRQIYPYFFRTIVTESEQNKARIFLLKTFNWTKVSVIFQNIPYFQSVKDDLINELTKNHIEILTAESFTDNSVINQLENIKVKHARIIIAAMYEDSARNIMCQVYRMKMYGPRYVWIFPGFYSQKWWLTEPSSNNFSSKSKNGSCTAYEMSSVLKNYIGINGSPLSTSENLTIGGITPSTFVKLYQSRNNISREFIIHPAYAYDAVWAIATTLDNVSKTLRSMKEKEEILKVPENISARNSNFISGNECNILENFKNISECNIFKNVSDYKNCHNSNAECRTDQNFEQSYSNIYDNGNFSYNGLNCSSPHNIVYNEQKSKRLYYLGDFDYANQMIGDLIFQTMSSTKFLGVSGLVSFNKNGDRVGDLQIEQLQNNINVIVGKIPVDASDIHWLPGKSLNFEEGKAPKDYPTILFVSRSVGLSTFCTFVAINLLGILYASTLLAFNIYNRNKRLIRLSSPNINNMIGIGCIICYASSILFLINNNFTPIFSKQFDTFCCMKISDLQLFSMVAAQLVVDFLILTIWQIMNPLRGKEIILPPEEIQEKDVMVFPKISVCNGAHMKFYLGFLCFYKALLLVYGAKLAWNTRKIQIPGINDSPYIGVCIYNVALVCSLGTPVIIVLSESPISAVIISSFITYATTLTCTLIFVPKIIGLRNKVMPENKEQGGIRFSGKTSSDPSKMQLTRDQKENSFNSNSVLVIQRDTEINTLKEILNQVYYLTRAY